MCLVCHAFTLAQQAGKHAILAFDAAMPTPAGAGEGMATQNAAATLA